MHAVYGPVVGHLGASELGEGREHIYTMHDLVANATSRNLPGPANDERDTNAALERGEIRTAPRACPAVPRFEEFRTVVAGEDDDGVVTNAEFVYGVEHLPDVIIHLGQHVCPVAVPGLTGESGIRQPRQMGLGEGHVREERLARLGLLLDERDRALRDLCVNEPTLHKVVVFEGAALFALSALHDFFHWYNLWRVARRR